MINWEGEIETPRAPFSTIFFLGQYKLAILLIMYSSKDDLHLAAHDGAKRSCLRPLKIQAEVSPLSSFPAVIVSQQEDAKPAGPGYSFSVSHVLSIYLLQLL